MIIISFDFFTAGGHLFDVIIFDVDNKDTMLGMSGPPPAFVESPILQKVYNLLTPRGTANLTIFVCFTVNYHYFSNTQILNGFPINILLRYIL